MRLAKRAFIIALTMLSLIISMTAQTPRSEKDPRNSAPTVGTGGPMGGPTGLFTVYDGWTLRRGEFTFSAAYSNFDRDPGNADFVEVPVSFQVGLSDHLELFFNTDAYRAIKVNSPGNLSGFYLPNSRLIRPTLAIGTANQGGGALVSPAAIILAPRGPGATQFPGAIFRPQGQQPFLPYPYTGGGVGNFGLFFPSGPVFGFPANTFPTVGPPRDGGGNGADLFPGIGSVVGGILPGLVLQTVCTAPTTAGCTALTQAPTVFTLAPSYLPDAPFLNRTYGQSAFNTFTAGGKWRWTGPNNPYGIGVIAYYRWYADKPDDASGFNQLQRGASPGGDRGDIGVVLFGDARVRKWMNISANIGYNWNSSVKGTFANGDFTLLDRPDEVLAGIAADFPVNRYFQPILEFRSTQYVGGRTPNAFENSPVEGLAGFRWFPARWLGLGFAYRHHFNQQDSDFIENSDFKGSVTVTGSVPGSTTANQSIVTSTGGIRGFVTSTDPHGFIIQGWIGRRNKRGVTPPVNPPANVTAVDFDRTTVSLPCAPGLIPREGTNCPEPTVGVRTTAVDPDNDVLVYNYTVSGGRIVGQGANVTWDLSGVRAGTYTLTVGVDDGCGVCGQTQTKTITVTECDCVPPRVECVCPTFSVSGGGQVRPGEPMTFTANVSGGTAENITYNWAVTAGTITSGQGTPTITVDTTGLGNTSVTATATIDGTGLCANCERSRSETGSVVIDKIPPFDTFGPLNRDDVRGRLDNFFVALRNDPTSTGYVVIDGPDRDAAAREKIIRDHIRFRRFPADRITIVRGDTTAGEVMTKLYVIPAGRTSADIQP